MCSQKRVMPTGSCQMEAPKGVSILLTLLFLHVKRRMIAISLTFSLNLFHHVLLLSWPNTKSPTGAEKHLKLSNSLDLVLMGYSSIAFKPKGGDSDRNFEASI